MPDFGRFFPLEPPTPEKTAPPELLGALHGPMNEGNAVGPRSNPLIPAGFSALGQFITHDIVKTTPSTLAGPICVSKLKNEATPFLDLDSVYGTPRNPAPQDPANRAKLAVRTENDNVFADVARYEDGEAQIPDPRNDGNLILSQLHLAFVRAHNRMVDGGYDFEHAQEALRLHYQWLVRHEYLPLICGDAVSLDELEAEGGLRLYIWQNDNDPFLPVEFTGAAFRFGHSEVRSGYRINDEYWLYIVTDDPGQDDLSGGRPVPPERVVSWSHFFEFPEPPAKRQQANRIDARLSPALLQLPEKALSPSERRELRSLATRDLQRGVNLRLPAGTDVASFVENTIHIEVQPLGQKQIWKYAPLFNQFADPLWYYILREAGEQYEGQHLGKLGARIVAETIIGLLKRDASSILNKPGWQPWLGSRGAFTTTDLLRFAGLPI